MIDTHAHFYETHFLENLEQHIADVKQSGVQEVWLPNCDASTWNDLYQLKSAYPSFFQAMVGLHPTYVKENYKQELAFVEKVLNTTPNLLAIGEIGLDYYWDLTFQEQQMEAFETQSHWALERHLWIDIHCRKAYADLIKVLRKKEFKDLRGIVHCFSGDAAEAKHCVDNGFYLGIGGVITYKNSNLFDAIKDISLDYIVLETDAPYLSPVPYRGKPNTPAYIPLIAQKLADLYEVSLDEVIEKTTKNAAKMKTYSGIE
jgi:TatD DNase family protein